MKREKILIPGLIFLLVILLGIISSISVYYFVREHYLTPVPPWEKYKDDIKSIDSLPNGSYKKLKAVYDLSEKAIERNDLEFALNLLIREKSLRHSSSLSNIASELIRLNQPEKAEKSLEFLEKGWYRYHIIYELAEKYCSRKNYNRAERLAESITAPYLSTKGILLNKMADQAMASNDTITAKHFFVKTTNLVDEIETPSEKIVVLNDLFDKYLKNNIKNKIPALLSKSTDIAKKIDIPYCRAKVFILIAERYKKAGISENSYIPLDLARETAKSIEDYFLRGKIQCDIFTLNLKFGRNSIAEEVRLEASKSFDDGLQEIDPIGDERAWNEIVVKIQRVGIASEETISILIADLGRYCSNAYHTLPTLGEKALPQLLAAFNDENRSPKIRSKCAEILLAKGVVEILPKVLKENYRTEGFKVKKKIVFDTGIKGFKYLIQYMGQNETKMRIDYDSPGSKYFYYFSKREIAIRHILNDFRHTKYLTGENLKKYYTGDADIYIAELKKLFKDSDPDTKMGAALFLCRLGDREAGKYLLQIIKKSDPKTMRKDVLASIGYSQIQEAVPELIKILNSKNYKLHKAARHSLVLFRRDENIPFLISRLKKSHCNEKDVIIENLKQMNKNIVIPALINALKHANGGYHYREGLLVSTLKSITSQEFGNDVRKWTEWWEANKEKEKP